MNNHMEQAAKAAKKPPTNEATAGLSSASDIGPYPNFGVAVQVCSIMRWEGKGNGARGTSGREIGTSHHRQ